jgi:hypothetical protein
MLMGHGLHSKGALHANKVPNCIALLVKVAWLHQLVQCGTDALQTW